MVVNENVSYISLENPQPEPVKIKISAKREGSQQKLIKLQMHLSIIIIFQMTEKVSPNLSTNSLKVEDFILFTRHLFQQYQSSDQYTSPSV